MQTREPGTLVAAGLMFCAMAVGMVTTVFVSLFWVLGCSGTENAAGPAPGTTQRAFCDTLTSPGGALICVLAYVTGGIALALLAGRWRNGGRGLVARRRDRGADPRPDRDVRGAHLALDREQRRFLRRVPAANLCNADPYCASDQGLSRIPLVLSTYWLSAKEHRGEVQRQLTEKGFEVADVTTDPASPASGSPLFTTRTRSPMSSRSSRASTRSPRSRPDRA